MIACFLALLSAAALSPPASPAGALNLKFENVDARGGVLRLALYEQPDGFLKEEKAALHEFEIKSTGEFTAAIQNLPFGTYAFAVFQDVNRNGELDTNLFGIPTEPYAFSAEPRTKWRAPDFEEVKFDFRKASQTMQVKLTLWKL